MPAPWYNPIEWSEEIPSVAQGNVPTVEQVLAQLMYVVSVSGPSGITVNQANNLWSEKPAVSTLAHTGRNEYYDRAHRLILMLAEHNIYVTR